MINRRACVCHFAEELNVFHSSLTILIGRGLACVRILALMHMEERGARVVLAGRRPLFVSFAANLS
jgi:hypothetical protein